MKKALTCFIVSFIAFAHGINAQVWSSVGQYGISGGLSSYNSIAIDGSGSVYIAYRDHSNSDMATVMKYNGTSWTTVGSAGFSSVAVTYTNIAISGSGIPYVAFSDGANGNKATVMKYNGSSWVTVGSADFSAAGVYYTTIAIDASGTPYVAYHDLSLGIVAMEYNGSSWVEVGGTVVASTGDYPTLVLDGSGNPYVVYSDNNVAQKTTVKKYNGTAWATVGSAGFSAAAAYYTSIALGSGSTPYVVYQDVANSNKATVMKYNGSSWAAVGSVGFSAGGTQYNSIAVNSSGTPYVIYQDQASGSGSGATVMSYNGSSWVDVGPVNFSMGSAAYTALAINAGGIPYTVCENVGNGYKATVMSFGPIDAITGTYTVCPGYTTTLSNLSIGGSWSSSNVGVATVDSYNGLVSGIAAGTTSISYTQSGSTAVQIVTVNSCTTELKNITTQAASSLTLFPNPTHNTFTLHLTTQTNEPATITITNILGEKIKQLTATTNTDTQIQLNSPPGIYFISATTKQGSVNEKIMLE